MSWVEGHWQNGKWVEGYYRGPGRGGWLTALAIMSHPAAQRGAWTVAAACLAATAALVVGVVMICGAVLTFRHFVPRPVVPHAAATVAIWPPGMGPNATAPAPAARRHRSAPRPVVRDIDTGEVIAPAARDQSSDSAAGPTTAAPRHRHHRRRR